MQHDVTLIATLAVGFVLAFVFGYIASRLRLPPLVGYLVAGVALGPYTPGFDADAALAGQLAEVGVILLMFGVGLHFSVADLMAVRRIAIPGAVIQIALATLIGVAMSMLWGWSFGGGLVLGLCLSVASTVVVLKALEERNILATPKGRVAVGWLIVEDLMMVLVLVLLPALAELLGGSAAGAGHANDDGLPLWLSLGFTLAKVACFGAIALMFGPRVMPWLLRQVARTGSRELFTLSVLAIALGIAAGSAALFGVSFALGAFFAGVILNESELSHKAAANSLPLQDAFAVLFFVSVGMLFDPSIIVREPLMVAGVLLLILLGKAIIAMGIVWVMGYPISMALTIAAALAQIGEFSFILAGIGLTYHLMPPEGLSLILAGALLSITLNPLVFAGADRIMARINANPGWKRRFETERSVPLAKLQAEFDAARERAEKKAEEHKIFTPQELVDRFPMFSGLTPEQREVVALHFQLVSAEPGQRIIHAGDEANAVYFISSGEVEVRVGDKRIKLGAGDFFGEMALLSDRPRTADVTTLDYCKFVILNRRDFRDVLRRYPLIRDYISELAAKRGDQNQPQQPLEETG